MEFQIFSSQDDQQIFDHFEGLSNVLAEESDGLDAPSDDDLNEESDEPTEAPDYTNLVNAVSRPFDKGSRKLNKPYRATVALNEIKDTDSWSEKCGKKCLALFNAERTLKGARTLIWDQKAHDLALEHAQDMVRRNLAVDHDNWVKRANKWKAQGYSWAMPTENCTGEYMGDIDEVA